MASAAKLRTVSNDQQRHALVNGILQECRKLKKGDKCVCMECSQRLIPHLCKATMTITLQHRANEAKNCILTNKDITYYVELYEKRCKHEGRILTWNCAEAGCEEELAGPVYFYSRNTFRAAEMKERIMTATTLEKYCVKADSRMMEPSRCESCIKKKEDAAQEERRHAEHAESVRMEQEEDRRRVESVRVEAERAAKAEEERRRVESARIEAERAMKAEEERRRAESAQEVEEKRRRAESQRMEMEDERNAARAARMEAVRATEDRIRVKMADERKSRLGDVVVTKRSDEFKERSERAKRERQQEIAEATVHKNKRKVNSITNYFTCK